MTRFCFDIWYLINGCLRLLTHRLTDIRYLKLKIEIDDIEKRLMLGFFLFHIPKTLQGLKIVKYRGVGGKFYSDIPILSISRIMPTLTANYYFTLFTDWTCFILRPLRSRQRLWISSRSTISYRSSTRPRRLSQYRSSHCASSPKRFRK